MSLAQEMFFAFKNQAVGVPEVGAEGNVLAARKLRIQVEGRFGATGCVLT